MSHNLLKLQSNLVELFQLLHLAAQQQCRYRWFSRATHTDSLLPPGVLTDGGDHERLSLRLRAAVMTPPPGVPASGGRVSLAEKRTHCNNEDQQFLHRLTESET